MRFFRVVFLVLVFVCCGTAMSRAAQNGTEEVHDLGTVQVMEKGDREEMTLTPDMDVIRVDDYDKPGVPQNVVDLVKDLPIFDFRGASDLVPDDDTIYMRGFHSKRFVTAMDGLTLRKSGGRKSSHIVDYGLLPPWMIEEIEVLPGPHSALYPSKSIGGVLNLKTRTPKRYETNKPDINLKTSLRSYNTQDHQLDMHGGKEAFIYDAGVQKYHTDGYLRHNGADILTLYGRAGYVQENGGHVTLASSFTDADRQIAVKNDPTKSDYDSDYPTVKDSEFNDSQNPTWDKIARSFNTNVVQPSPWGTWNFAAMYSEENRDRAYEMDGSDDSWETKWRQWSSKLSNELEIAPGHELTTGLEMAELYDGYGHCAGWKAAYDDHLRIRTWAGFAQYDWDITSYLNLRAGLRYENLKAWVNNVSSSTGKTLITGREDWIERHWDQLVPKSFLTWDMDHLTSWLRDTSLSAGVSRIWRAPDYHGDINPQGDPTGAWLDPEHGMGYDLVFQRRLLKDIQFKTDFSFYEIKDFLAYNYKFKKKDPGPAGQEYKDKMINLEKVWRKGVEVSLNGHLFDPLYFYVGYAYVDFESRGDDEDAGKTELDGRAKHRVNAGVKYDVLENTRLLVDYKYQDNQVVQNAHEDPPGSDDWHFTETAISAYNVVDAAVEQTLFKEYKGMRDAKLKLFATNIFDERYENQDGYPATDRTIGAAFSISF